MKTEFEKMSKKRYSPDMQKVQAYVEDALILLEHCADKARLSGDWGLANSFEHSKNQLLEFISCDHGESGFMQFRKVVEKTEGK